MMTSRFALAALGLVTLLAAPRTTAAQPPAASTDKKSQADREKGKNADETLKAYSVPESPAFSFLDVSPAEVSRPTTPRDFVSSLVDAIDETGRVRQGLALEVQPSAILRVGAGLEEYMNSPAKRTLTNAQVSFATVRSSGDSTSTDLAYGLRLTLFDRADPMADKSFGDSLANVLGKCAKGDSLLPPLPGVDPAVAARLNAAETAAALANAAECNRTEIARLRDNFAKAHWNDVHVALSYAGGHRLSGSLPNNPNELGHRVWLVAGVPISTYGQFLGYYRFSNVVPNDATARVRSSSYGGRAVFGKPTFNAFAELVAEHRGSGATGDKNTSSWSGGLEFRVSDQLWLSTGLGTAADEDDGPTLVIANLRWGFSDKARFSPK